MVVTDPIADYLTRIRNALMAKRDIVSIPASKVKIALTHLLKEEGYIRAYKCIRDGKQGLIKIALKYEEGVERTPVIKSLKRESKPGCRRYVSSRTMPVIRNGFGVAVVSTSQGIMSCAEAKKRKVGGEYLCSLY